MKATTPPPVPEPSASHPPTALATPSARAWRAHLRRARSAHHTRSRGDALTDLYMLLWVVVVYGGILGADVRRHLSGPAGAPAAVVERAWLGAAVLLAGTGLAWAALRVFGPLLVTEAGQAWGLSTPIGRRAWLLPRFLGLVGGSVLAGAVAGAGFSILSLRGGALGPATLAGAGWGLAAAALAVLAQRPGADARRWPGAIGATLLGAGALAAAAVVGAHYAARLLPRAPGGTAAVLALAGVAAAGTACAMAVRGLARLDRPALGAGAALAGAAVTAAVGVDPSLLSRMLEVRRWRRVGRVRSRRLATWLPGRWWALLEAETWRLARRPGAIAVWAALALAQYALAVVAPSVAGVARIILAYIAAGRLSGGLRAVSRSPALRRALGGDELGLRLVHVAIPALATLLWWSLTIPAGGAPPTAIDLVLVAGVVAAAYRAATRGPLSYGGLLVDTPVGMVPVDLVRQLARGPDVLTFVILLQALGH